MLRLFPSKNLPQTFRNSPENTYNIPPKTSPTTYQTLSNNLPKTYQTHNKNIPKIQVCFCSRGVVDDHLGFSKGLPNHRFHKERRRKHSPTNFIVVRGVRICSNCSNESVLISHTFPLRSVAPKDISAQSQVCNGIQIFLKQYFAGQHSKHQQGKGLGSF